MNSGCRTCRIGGSRVLVAVSGGADSVALLRGLLLLQSSLGIELYVGHLNHQLRGSASELDAEWVRSLSVRLGVPCHIASRSVSTMPEMARHGLEGTARQARRDFLLQTARDNACTQIVLAHTSDDQVETILHHIVRGTGLAGLAGIQDIHYPTNAEHTGTGTRIAFVRPMLSIDRPHVERFLHDLSQDYRTDDTNQDTRLTRNRIRHDLLPLLERDYNPQVRQALLRLGQHAREVHSHEDELAQALLKECLLEASPTHCRLQCQAFQNQPSHRIRECLVKLWKLLGWPRQHMGFREWSHLVQMLEHPAGSITLPGRIQVCRRDGLLVLERIQ